MSTPTPRPRPRRNAVINLSSSSSSSSESSQAIEEHLFHSDSSPHRKKSITRSTNARPESISMRSASYGMFSGVGPGMGIGMRSLSAMPSSTAMRSTPDSSANASPSPAVRRRRIASASVSQRGDEKKREDGKKANRKNVRKKAESPLFEPERGYSEKSEDEDEDMDVEMQSPSVDAGSRKKRRLVRSRAFRLTNRVRRPYPVRSYRTVDDYDSDPDGGIIYPPHHNEQKPIKHSETTALDPLLRIYAAHPLPGDSSLVHEYRAVLEQIDQQLTFRDPNSATLVQQDTNLASIAAKLESLPTLTAERDGRITEALAAAIKQDMNQAFSSPEAVSASVATRQAEAEQAREELGREMAGLKVQWEDESKRIEETKMEWRNRMAEVEERMEELKKRKTEIEERGGMAMVFELCRHLANGGRWGDMLGRNSREE